MSVALVVIGDGRDGYLTRSVASAAMMLDGPITERIMFDDTGDDTHRALLAVRYPDFEHINGGPRRGFGGAIRYIWDWLAEHSSADWIWWNEQDFTYNRGVSLPDMIGVMQDHPHLLQLALRRQAWNQAEVAAGGVVELNPAAYEDHSDYAGNQWLEHRAFWTTNPSLFSRDLCYGGWDDVPQSEGVMTAKMLEMSDRIRFGYFGSRESEPWVTHIGDERIGTGY